MPDSSVIGRRVRSVADSPPVEGLLMADSRTERLLKSVPEPLRRFHRGQRILVVDDFEPTAKEVQRDLLVYYPRGLDNRVEYETDPLNVADRMAQAVRDGKPYTVLVLDLRMPRKNGDGLLRDLAKNKLLCPVVIHSASHAKRYQMALLPQIDNLRTEDVEGRMRELESMDRLIEDVKTTRELDGLTKALARKTDGVPFRFVLKYGPGYGPEQLMKSVRAVAVTGVETDWGNFNTAVSKFKPVMFDAGANTEYVEELSETVKLVAKKAEPLLKKIGSEVPNAKRTGEWSAAKKTVEEFKSWEYSTEGLSEEKDDLGAARRHSIGTVLAYLAEKIEGLAFRRRWPGELEEIKPGFKGKKALLDGIRGFRNDTFRLAELVRMPRCLKEDVVVIDVGTYIKHVSDNQITGISKCRISAASGVRIKTPGMLFEEVISQPIMNAVQWTKDRPGRKVGVTVDKKRVSDLDARSKKYFRGLGLRENDEVGHLLVEDNGPGIPPEDLARLGEAQFTTRKGGSGFGLHYLRRYIGRMDGTYHVESQAGAGTRFHMYFRPATEADGKLIRL